MLGWFRRWKCARTLERRAIPDALWALTLARFPFLVQPNAPDASALREMATHFLARKEFSGVDGLVVDDAMAVSIAAQACLPVLKLGLDWYDGFIGIVVHADVVVARRAVEDDSGVVHEFDEELTGEAMHGGPVMLSWRDVEEAGESAAAGYNVVIHEFAHVLDMRNGRADGMPALPTRAARESWMKVLTEEYDTFCAQVDAGDEPLLDPYGAEAPEEFFAVASEAFFVAPSAFRAEHPRLHSLFVDFYRQDPVSHGV